VASLTDKVNVLYAADSALDEKQRSHDGAVVGFRQAQEMLATAQTDLDSARAQRASAVAVMTTSKDREDQALAEGQGVFLPRIKKVVICHGGQSVEVDIVGVFDLPG
jgi:hypothetical protein